MSATDELLAIEKKFWTGDSAFFEKHVDKECLVAFSAEMAGVVSNKGLAAAAGDGNRWQALDLELKGLIHPLEGVVVLSYEAKAIRANGDTYAALVSTGYVWRGDGWRMMFHQHTPLEASFGQHVGT